MPQDPNYIQKLGQAYNSVRKFQAEQQAKQNPYNPPESPSIQQQRQQLESNIQSQAAQQRNYNFEPKTQPAPKTDSAWQDVIDNERKAARARFEARKAEKLGLAQSQTNQTGTTRITPLRTLPGAEIPHLAVGSSVAGRQLSTRAFGVTAGGFAAGSGVGAGISLVVDLANGQDPIKAGFRAIGFGLGSFAGGVLGAAVGGAVTLPLLGTGAGLGGIVGASFGGIAGQTAAENIYNFLFGKKQPKVTTVQTQPIQQLAPQPLFKGGQCVGVRYDVHVHFTSQNSPEHLGQVSGRFYGPIQGTKFRRIDENNVIEISCRGAVGEESATSGQVWRGIYNSGSGTLEDLYTPRINGISRVDGLPDNCGDFTPAGQIPGSQDVEVVTAPQPPRIIIQQSPYIPPSATYSTDPLPPLEADKPLETNKRKTIKIQIPQNTKATVSQPENPNGITLTMPTGDITYELDIPTKSNSQQPNQIPINISNPADLTAEPTTIITPSLAPIQLNIPGYQPITIDPAGDKQLTGGSRTLFDPRVVQAVPVGQVVPEYTVNAPLFDRRAVQPTPVKPTPVTPTIPVVPVEPTEPEIPFDAGDIITILTALSGLKPIIDQINKNTSPGAIETATGKAFCQELQPGRCGGGLVSDARQAAQNSNATNNVINAAELGLLRTIDTKLGAQIPGGLAGGLGRLSKFLGIDRLFNLLNFLVLLHNASMLSGSLKVTLLETLSSLGNATGLLQTSEGDNVDLNQVFNKGIESFIVSLIGADAWASLKLTWRKYSPIYRAMNNGLSHIGNMFSSIGNGIEVIGERTGKIGNSLRAAGVVRENAYNYMSERMNIHTNKFMTFQTTVGGVTEVLEAINEVAESTIEGQESYAEAVKATAEFKKLLNESDKNTPSADAENKAIKAEAEKIKENLAKDPTGEDEDGLLSFLTDL